MRRFFELTNREIIDAIVYYLENEHEIEFQTANEHMNMTYFLPQNDHDDETLIRLEGF